MNNDQLHIDPAVIARFLSGDISPEERDHVLQWIQSSTENKKQFEEFQEVWLMMDNTSPQQDIDVDAEWNHLQETLHPPVKSRSRNLLFGNIIRIAAAVLIILGISYAGWTIYNHKSIESPLADTRHVTLPDGSQVTLNAGSELTFVKTGWGKNRLVSLRGEAFFEVTKNPQLPFVIRLEKADVKVLGTSFNVKAYDDVPNIEVTVSEGTVSVSDHLKAENKVVVTSGEKAVFNKSSGKVFKETNEDKNYIAWKTKAIQFENDSLPVIVKTLQSVYHRNIILQSRELSHCTITTTFENKDLDTILHVLKSTLDITIEDVDGKIVIKGKGC